MKLAGPGGELVSVDGASPGQTVVIQTEAATVSGTYVLDIQNLAGTGTYDFAVLVNAALELESAGGGSNDAPANAQDLGDSLIGIPGVGDRLAVVGKANSDGDYYRFSLTAGQPTSIVVDGGGQGALQFEWYDANHTLLALPETGFAEVDLWLTDFRAPQSGDYLVHVVGTGDQLYLLTVLKGGSFGLEQIELSPQAGQVVAALGLDGADEDDRYVLPVAQKDTLTINAGTLRGDLVSRIRLYDHQGNLIASEDNAAGEQAIQLSHTIQGEGGDYLLEISRAAGGGEYVLSYQGATPLPSPEFFSRTFGDGGSLGTFPRFLIMELSAPIQLPTVQSGDLTVNAMAAQGVTAVDGTTLSFDVANTFTGNGMYVVELTAGALTAIDGRPSAAFRASFDFTDLSPKVVASSIDQGAVVSFGDLTYVADFSNPLSSFRLDTSDVHLTGTGLAEPVFPVSIQYSSQTLTARFDNVLPGDYQIRLLADDPSRGVFAIRDTLGNPLDGSPSFPLPSGDGLARDDFLVGFTAGATADPAIILDLQAGSDTGASDRDNITADNTPTFTIMVNEAGTIGVDFDGDGTEDAVQAAGGFGTVTLTAPALADGTYTVGLPAFFEQVRSWYGHSPDAFGPRSIPEDLRDRLDRQLTYPTHSSAFVIRVGEAEVAAQVAPADPRFADLLQQAGQASDRVQLIGPSGFGDANFIPLAATLPYTIEAIQPATSLAAVKELRILQPISPQLDIRTFRISDLELGDLKIDLPNDRAAFTGEFDFSQSRGYVLQVTAGVDVLSRTATWRLRAVDPVDGLLVGEALTGFLAPGETARVGYQIEASAAGVTGDRIETAVRVFFDAETPADSAVIRATLDVDPPITSFSVRDLGEGDYQLDWSATDDPAGSGVADHTVYASLDGRTFAAVLRRTTELMCFFDGEPGQVVEFVVRSADRAGNVEPAPDGVLLPPYNRAINLGTVPDSPFGSIIPVTNVSPDALTATNALACSPPMTKSNQFCSS